MSGLLKLIPGVFKRLKEGSIGASVAREIAKLPPEEQKQFVKMPKITLKKISEVRRDYVLADLDMVKLESVGKEAISTEKAPLDDQKEPVTPRVSCTNHYYLQAFVRVTQGKKQKRVNLPYKACPNCGMRDIDEVATIIEPYDENASANGIIKKI